MTYAGKKKIPETKMNRVVQIQSRNVLKWIGGHFKEKIEIKHKKLKFRKGVLSWDIYAYSQAFQKMPNGK